jgi:dephospho-CoA kinase
MMVTKSGSEDPVVEESDCVGLTGGIASGKTTVAAMFEELGAAVLDADREAREAVRPGAEGWRKLREYPGPEYFDSDGTLNRRKLRERIIEDPDCRARVESILHPIVMDAMEERGRRIREREPGRLVLFDVPLLFEAGMAERFDVVILVYVPREVQIERLMERDGISRGEAEATLRMQIPIEDKKRRSEFVIDNSGPLEQTRRRVREVWESLRGHVRSRDA